MKRTKLFYGQVGGTLNAFIGDVHRKAIAIDGQAQLVAGCFSSSNQKANAECGRHYGLEESRIYTDYKAMAEAEAARKEGRMDFVVICTPNSTHFDIAKAFIGQGFNVVCEKPLCFTSQQGEELCAFAKEKGVLFGVTYTYTGYNMVKQAKQIVKEGLIGDVVDIKAEYLQDWLAGQLDKSPEAEQQNLAVWRMDPRFSGISNCVGDIGTHIEETVRYITGLQVKRLSAVLDKFGRKLDLSANMLVEFDNGAHGTFSCCQVAIGYYNGLKIRVFGTKGAIEWEQEHPDFLKLTLKGQPTQILTRGAHSTGHALALNRIPCGHPEGLTMAFANIYKAYTDALLDKLNGEPCDGEWALDFPKAEDGLRGVKFIEACVESSEKGSVWVNL